MAISALSNAKSQILSCNFISTENFSEKHKILLQIIGQVAVRVLHIFVLLCIAGVVYPLDFFLFPAIAVGISVFTGFFFSKLYDKDPPQKISPVFPASDPLGSLKLESLGRSLPGIYGSGKNSSLNALIQFIDSDPDLANRLKKKPMEGKDFESFQEFLAPLHPPLLMVQRFKKYLSEKKASNTKISSAFLKFAKNDRASSDEISDLKNFGKAYYRQVSTLRSFSRFLNVYDRALDQNSSIVDSNSQMLRYSLSLVHPSVPASDQIPLDPADLLNLLFDALPLSHKIEIQKSQKSGKSIERTALISLDINESLPDLKAMFEDRLAGSFVGGEKEKICFSRAPPAIRIQIKRFENGSYRFFGFENRKKKRMVPVQIPSQMKLTLEDGSVKEYRLASLVLHEGDSLKEGRFLAGRIFKGQKYLIDNQIVTPVDSHMWEKKILPKAYLLNYLPVL